MARKHARLGHVRHQNDQVAVGRMFEGFEGLGGGPFLVRQCAMYFDRGLV
jgi:hypothetical protein